MTSFIVFGMRGWRHVSADDLTQVDEGVLGTFDRDIFITTAVQSALYARGISIGRPGWENRLNDLVTEFVLRGYSSASIAQDIFIQLGQEEAKAMRDVKHGLIAQQRVREAVLAFNLLATGSAWQTSVKTAYPYRSRDWVRWCDEYLLKFEEAVRDIGPINFQVARSFEMAADDLKMVRDAFAATDLMGKEPEPAPSSPSSGGCYVATSVYGSYEAPEVMVLRKWRDERLLKAPAGRVFVRAYYAVSPHLVRAVGGRRWFAVPARHVLNAIVQQLDGRALR